MDTQCLIGELANQLGISPPAIRYYERLGLLEQPPRNKAGYRLYSQAAIERLQLIRYGQNFGLSLNQIKELLALETQPRECQIAFQQMLSTHFGEIEQQIQELTSKHQVLGRRLEKISTEMLGQPHSSPSSASHPLLDLMRNVECVTGLGQEGDENPDSVMQLLNLYDLGERNFQGLNLIGAKLNGVLLSGADLSRAELMLANLNDVSMDQAKLRSAYLSGADMIGAYLQQTDLTGATLIGTDLSEADLTGASLMGSNLGGACLYEANLEGVNLSEAILIGADLRGANLKSANLLGCNFLEANLEGALIDKVA